MPRAAPLIEGMRGWPPVAITTCSRGIHLAVGAENLVRAREPAAHANRRDALALEVARVNAVQTLHVGVPPGLSLAQSWPSRAHVESVGRRIVKGVGENSPRST